MSRWLALTWAFIALHIGTSAAQVDLTCFQNGGGVLVGPEDAAYDGDRLVFNQKFHNQPALIAYAYNEAQVQSILQCATANGFKAVPRGGGHGYEGYAVQDGTVLLDVTNMTSFSVDKAANTATFGPGLRLGQLYLQMYLQANSAFPAGTCPWVGTPGHLLGGGTGQNVRKYGLACDQIVSLNMVNYKGEVITASSTSNEDLLWASCGGGGGNLGIVTSFTVKLNSLDTLPKVTTMKFHWDYANIVQAFDVLQRWVPTADWKLNVQVLIGYGSGSVDIQWEGPQAEAEAAVNASGLLNVPGILDQETTEMSWINATLLWADNAQAIGDDNIYELNMTNGIPASSYDSFQAASSYNQEPMSIEGIQTMVNAVTSQGQSGPVYIEHKMLGGAVAAIGPTDTAFYYRNSLYETQYMYYWTSGNQEAAATQWLTSTVAAMKPYVGEGAYINYPDPILAATSNWPQAYYGGNLDRYVAVKTKYDPMNYFNNPLTVKPNGSPASTLTPGSPASSAAQPPRASPPAASTSPPQAQSPSLGGRLNRTPTIAVAPAGSQQMPAVSVSG